MAKETASYISQLVATNPVASDSVSVGDDHIRMVKDVLKTQFSGLTGTTAISASEAEMNYLDIATLGTSADSKVLTQASGVVTIAGDVVVSGTTPKVTIGDAGAEDTTLLFDGNAQDYYIALDDSADDLLIGLGSTVGTTPAISIDENLAVKTYGDITMTGTTPTLTIGDAGAEDTAIVFDGNAKDFYVALDDSADKLLIGEGSTVGTNPILSITDDTVTLGDGAAVDTAIVFDGNAKDFHIALDDSVDKLTTTVTNAAGAIKDYALSTVDAAKATIELNKAAELAAIQVQGLIEEYDRQAEKLRQTRDDETKTFAERIEANTKLGEVLKEQGVEMQKLVDIQVNAAQVEYDKNQSQENLIALTEALNERKAVEAQITGFQSEQLVNQVALEKELGEVKRELSLESLSGMALELEELKYNYEEKLRLAELAGEDTTAITEKYASDQAAIEKTYRDEELKKEKEAADKKAKWAKMAADAKLDIASSVAGSMVKILGEETEAGKAMAVVQATVDTYKGATAAYSAMAGIPYVGPVLGAAAAGAAIVSGLANVKAILSADESGAVDDKTVDATAKAPAPEMLSGKFELGGGMEPEPLKAFVVTDEMTNSQDQLANIRRRATV